MNAVLIKHFLMATQASNKNGITNFNESGIDK
jgi:hypothetical protein